MRFGLVLKAAAIVLLSTVAAFSDVGDNVGEPTGTKITDKAGQADAGGDFTYRVDIKEPEFRGVVPDFGLSYRSSRVARNDDTAISGLGWRLDGLSVIRRKSLGGGVPTYEDRADIYVIDGKELMACPSTAANPWTRDYPLRYIADQTSLSCRTGGNLTARVEDYTRYDFDTGTNTFTVTRRDGISYIYETLATIVGDTNASGTP